MRLEIRPSKFSSFPILVKETRESNQSNKDNNSRVRKGSSAIKRTQVCGYVSRNKAAEIRAEAQKRTDGFRISDGKPVNPRNAFPWMSLVFKTFLDADACAGVLIAHRWVLTAAHCNRACTGSKVDVILGAYNISKEAEVM